MAGILTIISLVFTIANVANSQSCQGRWKTAQKDECTLAINNARRVGSSSIACQPGECRDQWREAFAEGACSVRLCKVEAIIKPSSYIN